MRQAEEERKKKEQLKNPGVFERLTDEGRRIVNVDSIDGFRSAPRNSPMNHPLWTMAACVRY